MECFRNFTYPRSKTKLASRFKCNVYYYRANYVIVILLSYILAFYRNPKAFLALLLAVLAAMFLNDNFANFTK